MKTRILSIAFMLCLSLSARAQSLKIEGEELSRLLPQIEMIAGCRIFWKAEEVEGISVECEIADVGRLDNIMSAVLKGTGLEYSVVGRNTVFVLKGKRIMAKLPAFDRISESEADSASVAFLTRNLTRKASSENVIYSVGNSQKAQTGATAELRGVVSSFKTGKALAGVNLVVKEPWSAAVSGAEGEFLLNVPAGQVEVELSGTGITTTRRRLMVYEGGRIDIEIDDANHVLSEVEVTARRHDNVKSVKLGVQQLVKEEMQLIPTVFGETDVLRIVQAMPGVKTVGEATSGLNVRGGATDQNLILFNETTVFNPTHLFGFFSAFNSGLVSSVELYKSTLSAQYGGRVSSVLDIRSRQGDKETSTGTLNLGLLTSSMCVEGPIVKGKASIILSGRTTYSDWMLKKLPEKSGYKDGTANFSDVNVIYNHRLNSKNTLNVEGYYSYDSFSFMRGNKYSYSNNNASAKWTHFYNENDMLSIAGGFDRYTYQNRASDMGFSSLYVMKYDLNQYFLRANMLKKSWEGHEINAGANETFYNIMPGSVEPTSSYSIYKSEELQRERALESALYVNDEWELTKKLSFNLGLRYSVFSALGSRTFYNYKEGELPSKDNIIGQETVGAGKPIKTFHGPEFRLSFRYAFDEHTSVKGGINTTRQYIHKISNTLVISPTDTWKLSDRYVRPQRGTQFSAGLYRNFFNNELEASAEAYFKLMSDYLDYRSGAQLLMNPHLETDVLPTEGRAYGVELMLKKPKGRLNGWLSYTYSRTELRQSDKRIALPTNRGEWYPAEYDKPHELKFVGNYKFTKRYSMSLNVDYSTGRPMTMPVSRYYDHTLDGYALFYSDRNTVRIPDYFRMDLSFNILPTHHLTSTLHSTITLGVYNLTGRKNVYSIYFDSYGSVQGHKLSVFGMPIPFITYNVKF